MTADYKYIVLILDEETNEKSQIEANGLHEALIIQSHLEAKGKTLVSVQNLGVVVSFSDFMKEDDGGLNFGQKQGDQQ